MIRTPPRGGWGLIVFSRLKRDYFGIAVLGNDFPRVQKALCLAAVRLRLAQFPQQALGRRLHVLLPLHLSRWGGAGRRSRPASSAFSEFMRALDAHFAPASTSETAELLLERAKSFVLTPSRTLSALLEERLRAVELAGTHSQIGLYEYVRGTFSELVDGLPKPSSPAHGMI
eukprot:scaffold7873_cov149-Isochrysis_galbana.AAC.1